MMEEIKGNSKGVDMLIQSSKLFELLISNLRARIFNAERDMKSKLRFSHTAEPGLQYGSMHMRHLTSSKRVLGCRESEEHTLDERQEEIWSILNWILGLDRQLADSDTYCQNLL